MGRLIVILALGLGAYALWSGQIGTGSLRFSSPGAGFSAKGTSGGSVGSAAIGLAGRIGN
ncbi:MAG: hypothetical protein KDE03_08265 [Rhodobacteraceae bacterium]|nr:hypothetical protein [Paracoccaceae bacterium]